MNAAELELIGPQPEYFWKPGDRLPYQDYFAYAWTATNPPTQCKCHAVGIVSRKTGEVKMMGVFFLN